MAPTCCRRSPLPTIGEPGDLNSACKVRQPDTSVIQAHRSDRRNLVGVGNLMERSDLAGVMSGQTDTGRTGQRSPVLHELIHR